MNTTKTNEAVTKWMAAAIAPENRKDSYTAVEVAHLHAELINATGANSRAKYDALFEAAGGERVIAEFLSR